MGGCGHVIIGVLILSGACCLGNRRGCAFGSCFAVGEFMLECFANGGRVGCIRLIDELVMSSFMVVIYFFFAL